jgi:formylglycine-generating enzyme required for sulfatase activity
MDRLVARFLLAAAVFGLAATALDPAQEPAAQTGAGAPARRVALLVGINEYQRRGLDPLRWAEHDVAGVRQELVRLDFDKVVLMTSSNQGELRPTRDNILSQLKTLLTDVGCNDVVLVMLCGHGQQLSITRPDGSTQEDGFYCPLDAVVNEPGTMISLSYLTDQVLRNWGGRTLLLVDACRDGVFDRDRSVRSRGIQGRVVALPEDTAILFSCRAGQKSDERDALKHGVFTYSVLEALRDAERTGRDLTWDWLVASTKDRMAGLIEADQQEPIAAGAIRRIVLGRRRANPDLITSNVTGIRLKLIPRGTFPMGSPADEKEANDDEKPQHQVRISAFYLGVTEVTRGQFRRFVDETGYRTEAEKDGKGGHGWNEETKRFEQDPKYTWLNPGFEQTDDHPVVNVSWNDAVAFCEWLSRTEGQTYRLPTEAEWEYACRAGTTTKYSSGDEPESLAAVSNVADGTAKAKYSAWTGAIAGRDGFVYTAPVAQFRPNGFGLYDMHGNVWEWCRDGYDAEDYKRLPGWNPSGPFQAAYRVFRGGSWRFDPRCARSACRGRLEPVRRLFNLGFRLARVQSFR